MKCPYCGGTMQSKPDYLPMSPKCKAVFDFVLAAGPNGIPRDEVKRVLFKKNSNPEATLRTTMHKINGLIKPTRIYSRGGVMRIK